MIRKFKAQVVPTPALRALATMVGECDRSGWPSGFFSLREGARDAMLAVNDETDALHALLLRVDAGRGVATLFTDERDEWLSTAGVITVAIDVDLVTMLSDDAHGPDAVRAFVALLARVADSGVYALALRMGTKESAYEPFVDEVRRQAMERGILLDVSRPVTERPAEPPRGWTEPSRIDPRDVFGDVDPMASVFDEELDDDERAFLDEAGLAWPTRKRALEDAWRSVAFSAHPDRRPDDPAASRRFVRLKLGYERLRERAV